MCFFNDKRFRIGLLVGITVLALAVRIPLCLTGYPYLLNSDEHNVIMPALDMLTNGTYLVDVFYHPDHLQIKICAVLFNLYAFLTHGTDAASLGEIPAFYTIGRLVPSLCATAMVPIAYCTAERCRERTGLWTAFVIAFLPQFVWYSGFASPDMPLSLITLIVIYLGLRYLKEPELRWAMFLGLAIGLGMTIKYPAVFFALYGTGLAIIVNARARTLKRALGHITAATGTAVLTVLIVAPNLIFDFSSVAASLIGEARPNHLGADDLGFFGNLWFYMQSFFWVPDCTYNDTPYLNLEITIPLIVGIIVMTRKARSPLIALSASGLFWIGISLFALHWLRWGLPIYVGATLLTGIGLQTMSTWAILHIQAKKPVRERIPDLIAAIASIALCAVAAANLFVSAAALTKAALAPQTRIEALDYFEKHGINADNCASDGYSPLNLRNPAKALDSYHAFQDTPDRPARPEYICFSSYMYERLIQNEANPEYADDAEFFKTAGQTYELVEVWEATQIGQTWFGAVNVAAKVEYLLEPLPECLSGPDIILYRTTEQN